VKTEKPSSQHISLEKHFEEDDVDEDHVDDDSESNHTENNMTLNGMASLDYSVILNPGKDYRLQPKDVCLYISLVKEQNFNWKEFRTVPGIDRFATVYYDSTL
jgi:hypothetical protein